MQLISIYVHDNRYSVPTWWVIEIDPKEASAFARHLLQSSAHYSRVDLWLEDERIVTMESASALRVAA